MASFAYSSSSSSSLVFFSSSSSLCSGRRNGRRRRTTRPTLCFASKKGERFLEEDEKNTTKNDDDAAEEAKTSISETTAKRRTVLRRNTTARGSSSRGGNTRRGGPGATIKGNVLISRGGGGGARTATKVSSSSSSSSSSSVVAGEDEDDEEEFDTIKIFSINDVYELQNVSKLKAFVRENTNGLKDPHAVVLCGDFLSPSLLSSLDSGRAAVSVMNKVPVDYVCLGNHEFDHGTAALGARLAELNSVCLNTNVEVKTCENAQEDEDKEECEYDANVAQFISETPKFEVTTIGGLKIALLGLCTTTTPLSAAKKPQGVHFANCAEKTLTTLEEIDRLNKKEEAAGGAPIDVTIALTHQTLSEDDEYIRKVGEDKLDLILGGHEHQPFIGLVGDDEDVSKDAKKGVLCVKAGMDAENVVVVTIKRSKKKTKTTNNNNTNDANTVNNNNNNTFSGPGSRKGFSGVARAMSTSAGEWDGNALKEDEDVKYSNNNSSISNGATYVTTSKSKIADDDDDGEEEEEECDEECQSLRWEIDAISDPISDDYPGWDAVPNETFVTVERSTGSPSSSSSAANLQITAELIDLTKYPHTDPEIDADIYERSKVLRELHEFILPVHIHAERLALHPLSSKDARQQQCTLGTLFATMLRDEHAANACLYNSGGMRANATYDLKRQAFTYGDLVAEVPFENSIVKLKMTGREFANAVAFSERSKSEHASWGGYLQWDIGCQTVINPSNGRCEVTHIAKEPIDMNKMYTVVTWGGLLEGTDGIPQFQRAGERMAREHFGEDALIDFDELMTSGFFHEGTPFKTLIIRHLCRWRWRELQHKCSSFENLDYDEDGLLSASDVEKALIDYTDSKSPRLESESMVRLFESGLREDNGGVSKSSLDVCLEPFWKSETSLKLVEYEQSQLNSVDETDELPWWIAETNAKL
jgi:2',3'-cyclic-nucleotide 2'-phosphodiesterase (5'-nucleotidase family)